MYQFSCFYDNYYELNIVHISYNISCIQILINKIQINIFSWYPETKFNCANVRLPLSDGQCVTEFTDNQEIEVKAVRDPHPCYGWLKAVIKIIHGIPPSQFVVQYLDSPITEIVSPDRVRCRNTNAHINGDTFYKFDIEVPEDVRES